MRPVRTEYYPGPGPEALLWSLRDRADLVALDEGPQGGCLITWGNGQKLTQSQAWVDQARALLGAQPPPPGMPFAGGLIACIPYEAGAEFDAMPAPKPDPCGAAGLSGATFLRCDGALWLAPGAQLWQVAGSDTFLTQARTALEQAPASAPAVPAPCGRLIDDGDPERFLWGVGQALEAIARGDCYVLNLARRLRVGHPGDPMAMWRRLRAHNPARFGAFLKLGELVVVSASPELYLRVTQGQLLSEPIKGTRALGSSPAETEAQGRALLEDPKERAELTMITDLVRNDLGRVCAPGSVQAGPRSLRALPTLLHTHQAVSGRLRPGLDAFDALAASFPPGSVTGAPKVKVMELIQALEPCPRGVYTGAIGFFADGGDAALAVAIRVAVFTGDEAHVHVGCGVVADSLPRQELEESQIKASALLYTLIRR